MARMLFMSALIIVSACGGQATSTSGSTLTVFAAASLTDAFTELGRSFEAANPGVNVAFNFAGSNQLAAQIKGGAPVDVFASANERQMATAVESGRIDPEEPRIFVTNRLVAVFPADNPAGIAQLQDLARPGTLLVLASEQVPVGQYSLDFLDRASQNVAFGPSFREGVLNNVVSYEENVRSVLNKVVLGEADSGVVYSSDLVGVDNIRHLEIPNALNLIAVYPIAQLKDSSLPELSRAFVDFILSPGGREILARHGFDTPE
jgi:molybdate transport system substrate-binding protein